MAEATDADLKLLLEYDWPGNIRELAAVIDRAAILGEGKALDIATALGWSGQSPPRRSGQAKPLASDGKSHAATIIPLDEMIKQHIEAALGVSQGRVEGPGGAAKLLQVNPHTLRSRMRKLGIDWSSFRS